MKATDIIAAVLKEAQPIDQEQTESRIILEMILEMIIAFDAAGSGIMISYGSSFNKNGAGIILKIGEEWLGVEEEDSRHFILAFADKSGITLTDTYSMAYSCLHRISPPQQCKDWPSMVHTARVTLKRQEQNASN